MHPWRMLCCLLLGLTSGCSVSVTLKQEELLKINRIAVLPFSDAPNADAGTSGKVVAGIIASSILNIPVWRLVERGQIDKIIVEQDFQRLPIVDPSTAVKVGKLIGADAVVLGEVGQYRIGSIPFFFLFTLDQDVYKVDYAFRIIYVEMGEVCLVAHASRSSLKSFDDAVAKSAEDVFKTLRTSIGLP